MNIFQDETAQKIRTVQAPLKIKNGQSYKKRVYISHNPLRNLELHTLLET